MNEGARNPLDRMRATAAYAPLGNPFRSHGHRDAKFLELFEPERDRLRPWRAAPFLFLRNQAFEFDKTLPRHTGKDFSQKVTTDGPIKTGVLRGVSPHT